MIDAQDFIGPARQAGFRSWCGVPCSFLTPFINQVIDDPEMRYISSANEGDAVATATGLTLGGQPAVAMMQNSGLGNAVSPLSSLNWVFGIPVLLIITLRGEPGVNDEPQHELMGQVTTRLLELLQIPWAWFPQEAGEVEGALAMAVDRMNATARPYALVMRKGSVAPSSLQSGWRPTSRPEPFTEAEISRPEPVLSRREALQAVIANSPLENSIVIGTTGYTGRELFALEDRANHLYLVGSMGCASSLGLGLSLALPNRKVVVADGDGAALMRLGNLATVGAYGGSRLSHLVLDNGVHESTGGQATVSSNLSFCGVARACGYRQADSGSSAATLQSFLQQQNGPSLLHFPIRRGVPDGLPRPDQKPSSVARRLMDHLGVAAEWRGQAAG